MSRLFSVDGFIFLQSKLGSFCELPLRFSPPPLLEFDPNEQQILKIDARGRHHLQAGSRAGPGAARARVKDLHLRRLNAETLIGRRIQSLTSEGKNLFMGFDNARARALLDPQTPLIDVLLDQRVAAGIGNVFKSEVLFLERQAPLRTLQAGIAR